MKRGHLSMLLLLSIIVLTVLPFISAYSFGLGGSPFEYFDNEWVIFSTVVIALFACLYSFFKGKMQNSGSAVILSLGLSILISIPIMKRGIFDAFLDEKLVDLLILIALIAFLVILFLKFSYKKDFYGRKKFSLWRFFFFLLISAFMLSLIKDLLPDMITNSVVGNIINSMENLGWNLVIVIIICFVGYWGFKWFSGRRGGGSSNNPNVMTCHGMGI